MTINAKPLLITNWSTLEWLDPAYRGRMGGRDKDLFFNLRILGNLRHSSNLELFLPERKTVHATISPEDQIDQIKSVILTITSEFLKI
jgi:hypothetical protein